MGARRGERERFVTTRNLHARAANRFRPTGQREYFWERKGRVTLVILPPSPQLYDVSPTVSRSSNVFNCAKHHLLFIIKHSVFQFLETSTIPQIKPQSPLSPLQHYSSSRCHNPPLPRPSHQTKKQKPKPGESPPLLSILVMSSQTVGVEGASGGGASESSRMEHAVNLQGGRAKDRKTKCSTKWRLMGDASQGRCTQGW